MDPYSPQLFAPQIIYDKKYKRLFRYLTGISFCFHCYRLTAVSATMNLRGKKGKRISSPFLIKLRLRMREFNLLLRKDFLVFPENSEHQYWNFLLNYKDFIHLSKIGNKAQTKQMCFSFFSFLCIWKYCRTDTNKGTKARSPILHHP